MAWRNLWRNRRRTILTLSSIAFGVFLAILFTAMQDRNWTDMINVAARLGAGHVTLQHPEYLDAPAFSRTVQGTGGLRDLALQDRDVTRAVERIIGQVMLSTARESFGAGLVGFDPAEEDSSTFALLSSIVAGGPFAESDDRGVIVGERLASNLGVGLGDKVIYTTTDKTGGIVNGLARVSGLLRTGAPSIDGALCILPIDALRDVLGYASDETTMVAVFLHDRRRADAVADRLASLVGSGVAALPWQASQPELAAFVAIKVGGARFMEMLIAVLVAAGIFNTLFVSVMERQREFGIMVAIGWSPGRLFRLVMLESAWMGAVGLVAAAIVTAWPYYFLSTRGIDISGLMGPDTMEVSGVAMPSVFRVGIYPGHAAFIVCAAFVAVLLSGLYPAWKAGRVDPVETIMLV
jgi:ABC-type lipoprotein release transport system permease subunit